QLRNGLSVTGLGDTGVGGGAPWGFYIATFVWYVGIAHGGIAVSAAIRLLKLDSYKPIARIAEVVTIIALMMAGLSITFDLGRPDRIFNMIANYPKRVGFSPLIWDLSVVMTYLALSITYLVITMREDIAKLKGKLPKNLELFYKFVMVGYTQDEKPKVEQMAKWLAISLIALMALLSGAVVPWLFGLMSSQAGWFGAVQGAYFLAAALTSAIAAVIIVTAFVRKVFKWDQEIPEKIFNGLSKVLSILALVYLWFIMHEHLSAQYAGPIIEKEISSSIIFGRFSGMFFFVIGSLAMAAAYLGLQGMGSVKFNLKATVTMASLVVLALWVKRVLIVVPSLLYHRLPYGVGNYVPTWVEWSLFAGTIAIAGILFMLYTKVYPLMEVE
ncbi:MAG: polysulfide reductase NrfD, partial [Candidatus Aenigmarchaeota archaeon]|nr:polysulfide reductase NrfD [Candidatus Aenigmarchaeota archaeon]